MLVDDRSRKELRAESAGGRARCACVPRTKASRRNEELRRAVCFCSATRAVDGFATPHPADVTGMGMRAVATIFCAWSESVLNNIEKNEHADSVEGVVAGA